MYGGRSKSRYSISRPTFWLFTRIKAWISRENKPEPSHESQNSEFQSKTAVAPQLVTYHTAPASRGRLSSFPVRIVAIELGPQTSVAAGQGARRWSHFIGRDAGPVGADCLGHHRTAGVARAHQPADPAHGAAGARDPRGHQRQPQQTGKRLGRLVGVAVQEPAGGPRAGGLRGGNPRMHLQKHHTEAEHGQVDGEGVAGVMELLVVTA